MYKMQTLFSHKFLTLILLTSFIGLAVFGFATMTHAENHDSNGCIAAASREIDCSNASGPLAMFNLHINAIKTFSTLTIGYSSLQTLLLFVLSLILFLGLKMFSSLPINLVYLPTSHVLSFNFSSKIKLNQSAWFSLHENSPTFN